MIHCPRCSAALVSVQVNPPDLVPCPGCGAKLETAVFPALFRPKAAVKPESVVDPEDAGCFFHPQKKAVRPCERCGRFMCTLCDVELDAEHICPACLQSGRENRRIRNLEDSRILYDNLALTVAVLPALFFWFTMVTGPLAVFLVFRYWRAPMSLIPRTRIRFILALVFGVGQISLWSFGLYNWMT